MTAKPPRLNIGFGSGDPAGFPGYRPVNPWGRAMPKPKRPYRSKPIDHALYQVVLVYRDPARKPEPFGPKACYDLAGDIAEGVNKAIVAGKGGDYGVAHVVLVKPAQEHDTRTIGEILRG